ncbi:unnamed protein product [Cunninghamella blakesleeana]
MLGVVSSKRSSSSTLTKKQLLPQDKKMMRSTSFDSIQSTTSNDWHEEKHVWSFKTDYVSFPSLDSDEDSDCV